MNSSEINSSVGIVYSDITENEKYDSIKNFPENLTKKDNTYSSNTQSAYSDVKSNDSSKNTTIDKNDSLSKI